MAILAHILEIRPVERNGWIADIGWRKVDSMVYDVTLSKCAHLASSAVDVKAMRDKASSAALPCFGVIEMLCPRLHIITTQVKGRGTLVVVERPASGAKKEFRRQEDNHEPHMITLSL